ncbi:MAG: insulinase family protein [Burkholderiales bacterium]|nr:insulinase family protein [Burkholderiales bacterium]
MRYVRRSALALFLLLPFIAAGAAPALPEGITQGPSLAGISEFRLANGLQVVLIPDASQDTITVNVTYLVGSRHEGYGERGMAHLLEHMLFKGTPRHANIKGEFQSRGVRFNGTTSFDRTNYFGTFAASEDNLAAMLELEADRMVNSRVSKADLESEMTVVRNEFEAGENSPAGLLFNRMIAAAYRWHNYGHPVIGTRSDLEHVPIERLQAFYRRYYQPDNAALVIAGRFETDQALRLVAETFGRIPRPTRALGGTYTVEPPQDGEREVVMRRVGEVPLVSAMYHVPSGMHDDFPAIDLVTLVLTQQPSGRLHRALVESGKATAIFGDDRQLREPGSVHFGAALGKGQSLDPARDTLLAVVEGFADRPVTDEEVSRARLKVQNDLEDLLSNSRALAITLSDFIAMGDWRLLFWYRDRIGTVTREDVQRVATAYLRPANRTLGIFVPRDKAERVAIPAAPDIAAVLKDVRGDDAIAAGEAFDPTPAHLEARVIRRELAGGMKLALLPKRTRGAKVNATLVLHWGDEASTVGRSAACAVASAMLSRGTRSHTRAELRDALDRLRANVVVGLGGATIDTVRDNLGDALKLTVEMLREPAFPESEFEQVKQSLLTSIDSQRTDPQALSSLTLNRHLAPYPPGHWNYTPTLAERAEQIRAVSLEDARRCHDDFLGASHSELAVVGDFDADAVASLAAQLFDTWRSPAPYARIEARYFDVSPMDRVIETPDKANAVYRAGLNLRLRDDDPEFAALVLGNYLLGGSTDSRLWRRVRERDGLSYSVWSSLTAGSRDEVGEFGIAAIYAPQNRAKLEQAVHDELRRALEQGFTEEEVANAKKGLLKQRQLARNSDASLAARFANYLDLGRTFQWDTEFEARIAALTPDEIREALRRRLDMQAMSEVKAGDFTHLAATPSGERSN